MTAQAFARIEASSGIVLFIAAIIALTWANSPWDESYFELWETHVNIDADILHLELDLRGWVNDGLMTIFFFLMGLEIKRELVHGELSTVRRAVLPAAAAFGGMAAPALIYTAFNLGGEGSSGWGVPMATDIAFALGVLSLLSRRVPFSIRVFLLALAIADDIGAIVVIALFYSSGIDVQWLLGAAGILAFIIVLNRAGVRNINVYVVFGAALWFATHESGIHATIAGVVLGLMTPASHFYNPATFAEAARELADRYQLALETKSDAVQSSILSQMEDLTKGTEAPLERLERSLVHWVSFVIVPLFALANAGVAVSGDTVDAAVSSPVSQGVFLGLLVGKPLGIFVATFIAVKVLRFADMPVGAGWMHVLGVGMLGGVGFTVSLLITELGFDEPLLADESKLGVLAGSAVAGVLGFVFLFLTSRAHAREDVPDDTRIAATDDLVS